jgi:hypothetical protein
MARTSVGQKVKDFFMDIAKPVITACFLASLFFFFNLRDRVSQMEVRQEVSNAQLAKELTRLEGAVVRLEDRLIQLMQKKVYHTGPIEGILKAVAKDRITVAVEQNGKSNEVEIRFDQATEFEVKSKAVTISEAELRKHIGQPVWVLPDPGGPAFRIVIAGVNVPLPKLQPPR